MGFIPKGARWYLADIVLKITIEGDPRNVVHVNTHLIEADAPEQAFQKAVNLGQTAEVDYTNTEGKRVRIAFRGLRELNVISEELEDGAELFYGEFISVPEEKLTKWIRPRTELGIFRSMEPESDSPNFLARSVLDMLEENGFGGEDVTGQN